MTQSLGRLYYAHPVSLYGSDTEARIVASLTSRGFDVENPGSPQHQAAVKSLRESGKTSEDVMAYFLDQCRRCHEVAFSPFPDGKIGAGVVQEVNSFLLTGRPASEISEREGGIVVLSRVTELEPSRVLTVDETRARLNQLGRGQPRVRAMTP